MLLEKFQKLFSRPKDWFVVIGCLYFIISWVNIDRQKLGRKQNEITWVKAYPHIFKPNTETCVYQMVCRVSGILKVELLNCRDVIFIFFPAHVVNLYVHMVCLVVRMNVAVVKTGVRKVKINIVHSEFLIIRTYAL